MRKNILALSIAAMVGGIGFTGGASAYILAGAVNTSPATAGLPLTTNATSLVPNVDGIGHFLVIPYYTVRNGNNTLINLVNTDQTFGKAVKVRFRGAANSDDVFDFQVFLSPGDVWSANISRAADGRAQLSTVDKSCTLPSSVNQPFVTDRLPSTYTAAQKAEQTTEGYVEIFNMADIPKARYAAQVNASPTVGDNPLYQAIKHVGGIAPCTASTLARLAVDPLEHTTNVDEPTNAAYQGLGLPTTGLVANWTIINVPGTSTYTGTAAAISAVDSNGFFAAGRLVFHPQTSEPVTFNPTFRTTDPILVGGNTSITTAGVFDGTAVVAPVTPAMFDFPDFSTPYTGVAALSAALPAAQAASITRSLAVSSVKNEYLTNPGISAKTDWVFSSPTRRYSVGLNYTTTPFSRVFADLGTQTETYFYTGNTSFDASLGQICVLNVNPSYYDREEQSPGVSVGFVISPGTPDAPLTFCGEVSVLSFNNTAGTSVLGAAIARKDIDVNYTDGWMTIATPGNAGNGLPILGSAFFSAFNPSASAGVSGNYGLTFGHRYLREVTPLAP